jgi:hypothetical protein
MFEILSFQSYLHGDMKNWASHGGGMWTWFPLLAPFRVKKSG